jgi:hypothetical protein
MTRPETNRLLIKTTANGGIRQNLPIAALWRFVDK